MFSVSEEKETFLAGFEIEMLDSIDDEALLEFVQFTSKDLARSLGVDRPNPYGVIGSAYMPTKNNGLVIARKDGVPAAFIVWQLWEGGAFIGLAWTTPELRRCGLYAALVSKLKITAKAKGLDNVYACVDGHNARSIAAHNKIFGEPKILTFQSKLD